MNNGHDLTVETALTLFLAMLTGKNRSNGTIQAYSTDISQFLAYLTETDVTVRSPSDITKSHLTEYMTYLSRERALSGVSCARKLAALREYFRFLVDEEVLAKSPAEKVESPKQERRNRNRMRQDEYNRLLSSAGSNHRDYAILTVLLQCGLRVSELCNLAVDDIDLAAGVLVIRDGKGQADRRIALEKKATKALKAHLKERGEQPSPALFLNRYGEPLSRFGVRKLILRLCGEAGLEKKVSPHIFRHTFASMKAESGRVSPYQLQQWLGHKDLKTTQIYVHMSEEYAKKAMEATSL
jgi:integrase/recombinase XerC